MENAMTVTTASRSGEKPSGDEISVATIADIIKSMSKDKIETLSLLLSPEGAGLLERKKDMEEKKVHFLTRDEVFDV